MKISIISVGKTRSQPLLELEEEYRRRLRGRFSTERIAVRSDKDLTARLASQGGTVVVLDEHGKAFTSETFAAWLDRLTQEAAVLTFVVGGADGVPAAVRARAHATLALSALTLPHELALVVLLEQLYRAQAILTGHPYHRA